jgi:hypothetical protein
MIGAAYAWPATLSSRLQSRYSLASKVLVVLILASLGLTILGVLAGISQLLSFSTPILVVSLAGLAAITVGRLARSGLKRISSSRF